MKLSISNIGWSKEFDKTVYQLMKKYGYTGLEIAPTRIFPENPYNKLPEAESWSQNLKKKYGFNISSMQSIWFGKQERLFGSKKERQFLMDYTKLAIDFAEIIKCRNLVFGCPRNRYLSEEADPEIGILFFREIGDYAAAHGTVIGMEANPPVYHTNYINDTRSALHLIKKVNSKGFMLNLDIGSVIHNKEDLSELEGNVHLINHVHISEPELKPIKERTLHKDLKKLLSAENYTGYLSVEMGTISSILVIDHILQYVRSIFG